MENPLTIAAMFGVTPAQLAAQYGRNLASLNQSLAKAVATGKKVNGYSAQQLATAAAKIQTQIALLA